MAIVEIDAGVLAAADKDATARLPRHGERTESVLSYLPSLQRVVVTMQQKYFALASGDGEPRAIVRPAEIGHVIVERDAAARFEDGCRLLHVLEPCVRRDRSGSRLPIPDDQACDQ